MRVLFTTNPGSGHWQPLIPFADALRATGHEGAFAVTPSACAAISALDYPCFFAGADETAEEARDLRQRMAAHGADASAWVWPTIFAGTWAERRLPDLLAICEEWQPAVLVRENTEFAGCVAAERRELPHAAVQVTAWRPWFHPLIAEPLNHLRERVDLPPDPVQSMLYRFLLIVPAPPGFHDPAHPLPATARAVCISNATSPRACFSRTATWCLRTVAPAR